MTAFYETVARYYDAEVGAKTDDLLLYSRLAEDYGAPIFDVGCGTGRVLLHLAQEGYRVHGIDDSRQMLKRLENKLNGLPHLKEFVTYSEGDILKFQSKETYKLVLLTYNCLMHFHTQEKQIQLLERLHSLIDKEGLLVLDLPNAGEVFATQDTDAILLDRKFIEPETGHLVMVSSVSYMDRTTQLLQVDWIYDEIDSEGIVRRLIAPHILRYYFYAEIKLLLERTGFQITAVYGGTDEEPFEDGCERMIIYAQP
ncbi:MAG: class I SAM-dependent methyltransferase [Anaerolineae bacterium]|nr:class I SAM-dependent methyltransferase [Anaerolineae bacterium]